jgi:hypothetical protein
MKLGPTATTILGSSAFLLLVGCGGDPLYSSGVDGNKPVSSYTQSDAEKFCSSEASFVNGRYSHQQRCVLNSAGTTTSNCSASEAELRATCTAAYDACVADATKVKDLDPSHCVAALPGSTCQAKTSELNTCVSNLASALDSILASMPSCSAFTSAACSTIKSMLQSTDEACPTLKAACPDVYSAID